MQPNHYQDGDGDDEVDDGDDDDDDGDDGDDDDGNIPMQPWFGLTQPLSGWVGWIIRLPLEDWGTEKGDNDYYIDYSNDDNYDEIEYNNDDDD